MEKKWDMVPLGECAEIVMGQSPNGESYNNQAIGVPLINGPADYGQIHPEPKQWTTQATKMCVPGDIIFCVRASVGKLNLANDSCCIGRGVAAIHGKENVSLTEYLMHILAFHEDEFVRISKGAGTTFPNLTSKELAKHLIPLPPLAEQKRIASTLSAVDKAIEQAGIAIEESERMKRGLMQKLMDECNQKTILGDHISEIGYGYTESASDKQIGPKFLRITDLNTNDIEWNVVPYCKCNEKDFNKYRLTKGDVVFARIGATTGQAQLIRDNTEAVFASYLIRIKLEGTLLPEYLYQFTKSSKYWNQINAQKGAHMKGGINIPSLSKLEITYPPLNEQQHIIDILKSVDSKVTLCSRRKSLLETLKRGMMQQLLAGAK